MEHINIGKSSVLLGINNVASAQADQENEPYMKEVF